MRVLALLLALAGLAVAQDKPNILWITAEDHGPHMGSYGDDYADTPVLDALAARGMIYRNAWSTAPVCAPARTTIISGVYPPSLGGQHMRSMVRMPSYMKMYPVFLREAGYYVTNNRKTDYNLEETGKVWDESSETAHWKNRKSGQPFFAIFNFTESHESQLRTRPHKQIHDPAGVRVPAYHPDTPEVRQDWAQYYDKITEVDTLAGEVLAEVEAAGLADDTIVFYYADHGSGMPRNKRWPYQSGLHVPLIVHVPEKWRSLAGDDYAPGGESDRLVGFVDLAPTALSLAGIDPPAWMQGHAFLGGYIDDAPEYQFGFRGRMDERYDFVRTVRDRRYQYIRNFKPHRIYGQYIQYMFQTPTTRIWKQLYDAGKLNPAQSAFWETKPAEELYDIEADPDEVHNLVNSPAHRRVLQRLRGALAVWQIAIRDVGFLPEGEIHERTGPTAAPYDMGHDDFRFPIRRAMLMAQAASSLLDDDIDVLRTGFGDPDSAVRYWAAQGALARETAGVDALGRELKAALDDPSPYVRVGAAEAFGRFGTAAERSRALEVLMELASIEENGVFVSMEALNAIDYMDEAAAPARDRIAALPEQAEGVNSRMRGYVPNLLRKILADLDGAE